jgi:hypothetical protein
MDSVVALSLNQNVPVVRLLTEPIPGRNTDDARSWYVHHRVSDSVVEHALKMALQAAILHRCRRLRTGFSIERYIH